MEGVIGRRGEPAARKTAGVPSRGPQFFRSRPAIAYRVTMNFSIDPSKKPSLSLSLDHSRILLNFSRELIEFISLRPYVSAT